METRKFTHPTTPRFELEVRSTGETWRLRERAGFSFQVHAQAALAASENLGGAPVWWDHNGVRMDTTMGSDPEALRSRYDQLKPKDGGGTIRRVRMTFMGFVMNLFR